MNIQAMMKQAQKLQKDMMEAKREIDEIFKKRYLKARAVLYCSCHRRDLRFGGPESAGFVASKELLPI